MKDLIYSNELDFYKSKYRMDGNSTRMIDAIIQQIFKGGTIKVVDHYNPVQNIEMGYNDFERTIQRLKNEHRLDYWEKKGMISYDSQNFTIVSNFKPSYIVDEEQTKETIDRG